LRLFVFPKKMFPFCVIWGTHFVIYEYTDYWNTTPICRTISYLRVVGRCSVNLDGSTIKVFLNCPEDGGRKPFPYVGNWLPVNTAFHPFAVRSENEFPTMNFLKPLMSLSRQLWLICSLCCFCKGNVFLRFLCAHNGCFVLCCCHSRCLSVNYKEYSFSFHFPANYHCCAFLQPPIFVLLILLKFPLSPSGAELFVFKPTSDFVLCLPPPPTTTPEV
jgi:hypothetical protein